MPPDAVRITQVPPGAVGVTHFSKAATEGEVTYVSLNAVGVTYVPPAAAGVT